MLKYIYKLNQEKEEERKLKPKAKGADAAPTPFREGSDLLKRKEECDTRSYALENKRKVEKWLKIIIIFITVVFLVSYIVSCLARLDLSLYFK